MSIWNWDRGRKRYISFVNQISSEPLSLSLSLSSISFCPFSSTLSLLPNTTTLFSFPKNMGTGGLNKINIIILSGNHEFLFKKKSVNTKKRRTKTTQGYCEGGRHRQNPGRGKSLKSFRRCIFDLAQARCIVVIHYKGSLAAGAAFLVD